MRLHAEQPRDWSTASQHYVCTETNRRPNNEDSFHMYGIYLPRSQQVLTILALADGMGGHAWGEHVSREALRKVSLALFERLNIDLALNVIDPEGFIETQQLAETLEEAIKEANDYVLRMIHTNHWPKAGSTLTIVAILENQAVIVNIGDSPAFLYDHQEKRLRKVTIDDTVANHQLLAGKITPEMALHHSGRSVLKWHIGMEELPAQLHACCLDLKENDLILLCTDGVNGQLSEQQMAEILSFPAFSLQDIAQRLLQSARQVGEEDNQTIFLWRHKLQPGRLERPPVSSFADEPHEPPDARVSPPASEKPQAVVITQSLASEPQPLSTAVDLNKTIHKPKTQKPRKETQKLPVKRGQKDLEKTQKRKIPSKTTAKAAETMAPLAEQPAQED
ncbi:MAG TPA: protein phosphatase 2C domain-containing protein [Ktedonobacteraceae bacterium]|jgi:protein phosphatase